MMSLWGLVMANKQPALVDVLTHLLQRGVKTSRQLSGGLVIAYTPAAANDGWHRLTLSRERTPPSMVEVDVVKRELTAVLHAAGKDFAKYRLEPWLRHGKYRFHRMEWRELVQASLPLEE